MKKRFTQPSKTHKKSVVHKQTHQSKEERYYIPHFRQNTIKAETFDKTTPLIKELISFGAFIGDHHRRTHFSQKSFIIGYRNYYSFYDVRMSIRSFTNAIRFLRHCKISRKKIVFVGSPSPFTEEAVATFDNINQTFFPNDEWTPGFFSKNPRNCKCVLVIYDITTNSIAYREAVNANIPVVGFGTPACDIGAADYPVVLNLQTSGLWYVKLCKALYITKK